MGIYFNTLGEKTNIEEIPKLEFNSFLWGFKNNEVPDTIFEKVIYSLESPFLWMPILFVIIYIVKLYLYFSL